MSLQGAEEPLGVSPIGQVPGWVPRTTGLLLDVLARYTN